ncbi:MAG: CinA family protein [Pontimonas sp.]|nr:CinA family protein [Pontimonas sp.]
MSDKPADIIGLALAKGVTLGSAESLTGGLVASALVEVPGASAVFKGSIVAYDLMVKNDLLGVSAALLAEKGAVNADVAIAMAEGAQGALGVDLAVATTGVAGPDPDPVSGAKPGLVFVALAGGELGTMVREVQVEGDRADIRSAARRAALLALYDALAMRE